MMLKTMARVLRRAGLKVIEVPGWESRGHGAMRGVAGVLWHHTATADSREGNYPSLGIVRDGRSDLPGPLANLGLGRDGTWYVIAAGLAYHAGSGSASFVRGDGNAYLLGIEAENSGTSGVWPSEQRDSYRRGTAALLKAYGLNSGRLLGHKEWTSRKIDPYGLDMDTERAAVRAIMAGQEKVDDMELSDTVELGEFASKARNGQEKASVGGLLGDAGAAAYLCEKIMKRLDSLEAKVGGTSTRSAAKK